MNPLDTHITDLARQLFMTVLVLAGPVLVVGLVVGVAVSLFQALTSVQEQTLSLIPKMFAVIAVVLLLLVPAIRVMRDYAASVLAELNRFGLS